MKKPIPFGKYLLLDRINVGGMAEVFFAKVFGDGGGDQILAIKKILPTMVEDEEFISMFIEDARIAVQLDHQNIVQIFELGKHEENYYIAMEYLPGRDLRALLDRAKKRKEQLAIDQALFIASEMAHGLDYAHRAKDQQGHDLHIVHRDVSPQNILISYDGQIKLIDFGIAKAATRNQRTQAGILKGKFGYMSPEQVRGLPIDRRSDIFALGVILYEMLTGERLFVGESDFSILERVRNAEVPSPRRYNTQIPPELEQIVLRALTREPEHRYQWASDLAGDLLNFLGHESRGMGMEPLATFMRQTFGEDLLRERERMLRFSGIDRPAEVPPTALRPFIGSRPALPRSDLDETGEGDFETFETNPLGSAPSEPSPPPAPASENDSSVTTAVRPDSPGSPPQLSRVGPPLRTPEATDTTEVPETRTAPGVAPVAPKVPARGSGLRWAAALLLLVSLAAGGVFWFVQRAARTGEMVITTRPSVGVQVEVDGLPELLDSDGLLVLRGLEAGEHAILAKGPSGQKALTVQISPEVMTPVDLDLSVSGLPTPPQPKPDPPAPHPGVPRPVAPHPAAPPDGANAEVRGSASRSLELTIQSEPPEAEISIDESPMGRSPYVFAADRGRSYLIRAELPGYRSARRRARFSKSQVITLSLSRATAGSSAKPENAEAPTPREHHKASGVLAPLVISSSQTARVFVDGTATNRYTPVPPADPLQLPVGEHLIHLQTDDGKRADQKTTIKAGELNRMVGIEMH